MARPPLSNNTSTSVPTIQLAGRLVQIREVLLPDPVLALFSPKYAQIMRTSVGITLRNESRSKYSSKVVTIMKNTLQKYQLLAILLYSIARCLFSGKVLDSNKRAPILELNANIR